MEFPKYLVSILIMSKPFYDVWINKSGITDETFKIKKQKVSEK